MIDLRYHVFSLIAVFLALLIGIVMGTTIIDQGLVAEQKSQIKSLRETFSEIKTKNAELNNQVDIYRHYSEQTIQAVIGERLVGGVYAVVVGPMVDGSTVSAAKDTIAAAGGVPHVTVTLPASSVYADEGVATRIKELFSMDGDANALLDRVMLEAVHQLQTGENPPMLDALQEIGVIHLSERIEGGVGAAILAVPFSEDEEDLTDDLFAQNSSQAGFLAVAVCGAGAPDNALNRFKEQGISTVDHINVVPGMVALVEVLRGSTGNYGSGGAATSILPGTAGKK